MVPFRIVLLTAVISCLTPLWRPAHLAAAAPAEVASAECVLSDRTCYDWLRFRRAVAGPYQAIAAATHPGQATVVISEPSISRGDLVPLVQAVFGGQLVTQQYRRWPTGLDAWLEDLVITVRTSSPDVHVTSGHDLQPWNVPAGLADRLEFLYSALYGTTDGFTIDDINAMAARPVMMSAGEPASRPEDLFDWVTDASQRWNEIRGQRQDAAFTSVAASTVPSVFVRSDNALVVAVIPAKVSLDAVAVPFRRFAVASDLLLGAYKPVSGATVLIARARQEPFTTLPPLRFETFASFVLDRSTELVQSYERQRIFAGRIQSGPFDGWDWAPILLSRQLDDSEFGTLLNQADQILKSWSQAGAVDYYAFDHLKPPTFPFAKESASAFFRRQLGTTSLVFNWNTQNFSTLYQLGSGEFLAADRYGALPILYLPSGNLADALGTASSATELRRGIASVQTKSLKQLSQTAAGDARSYFAGLGDPILMRVVQNVLLFHVVEAFMADVSPAAAARPPARWETVSHILREEAATWLKTIAAPGPTRGTDPKVEAKVEDLVRNGGLTIDQLADTLATPQVTSANLAQQVARYRRDVDRYDTVVTQLEAAADQYHTTFDAFCAAVRGTIETAVAKGSGRTCRYSEANVVLGAVPQLRLTFLKQKADALNAEADALETSIPESRRRLVALSDGYSKARGLSDLLAGEAAFSAQLDRILARLREAVRADPPGSIRTAALVLSRNSEDEDSIGGHSISFDPARVRIAAAPDAPLPLGRGARAPAPKALLGASIREPGAAPAPEAAQSLKVRRRGSLLDEIRSTSGAVDARAAGDLADRARSCGCDALVWRDASGQLTFVRNAPPPITHPLVGTTEIADALAGPPMVKVVEFHGFDGAEPTVEAVTASVQNARNAVKPSGRMGDVIERAKALFQPADIRTAGEGRLFTYLDGERPQTFRIEAAQADVRPIMTKQVRWQAAAVAPERATVLADGSRATSVVVNFAPAGGVAEIRALDVRVVADQLRPATAERLERTVRATLAQGPARTPVAEGLARLREAIRRQMNTNEIAFMVHGGSSPVRVTRLMQAPQDVATR